jgi:hypothetical protein
MNERLKANIRDASAAGRELLDLLNQEATHKKGTWAAMDRLADALKELDSDLFELGDER